MGAPRNVLSDGKAMTRLMATAAATTSAPVPGRTISCRLDDDVRDTVSAGTKRSSRSRFRPDSHDPGLDTGAIQSTPSASPRSAVRSRSDFQRRSAWPRPTISPGSRWHPPSIHWVQHLCRTIDGQGYGVDIVVSRFDDNRRGGYVLRRRRRSRHQLWLGLQRRLDYATGVDIGPNNSRDRARCHETTSFQPCDNFAITHLDANETSYSVRHRRHRHDRF